MNYNGYGYQDAWSYGRDLSYWGSSWDYSQEFEQRYQKQDAGVPTLYLGEGGRLADEKDGWCVPVKHVKAIGKKKAKPEINSVILDGPPPIQRIIKDIESVSAQTIAIYVSLGIGLLVPKPRQSR